MWNSDYQRLEGEANRELLFNGYSVSVWNNKKVLKMESIKNVDVLYATELHS